MKFSRNLNLRISLNIQFYMWKILRIRIIPQFLKNFKDFPEFWQNFNRNMIWKIRMIRSLGNPFIFQLCGRRCWWPRRWRRRWPAGPSPPRRRRPLDLAPHSFRGSFSAGSKPIFASKYAFFSIKFFKIYKKKHLLASKFGKFLPNNCKMLQNFGNF